MIRALLGLCVMLSSLVVSAQNYVEHQLMVNEDFEHIFLTLPTPNNPQGFEHGLAGRQFLQVNDDGFHQYRLWYTPDTDYVGRDTLSIQYIDPATASAAFLYFAFEIVEYDVEARNDYVAADINETVVINVLENDYSSSEVVNLRVATLANYGEIEANIADSTVTFTPDPGFEGIAQFHYTMCDDMQTCDMGMVTIYYENDYSSTDSVVIATKTTEQLELVLPVKEGFGFIHPPVNGTASLQGDVIKYTATAGYVGLDGFTCYYVYDGNTNIVTYLIDVLAADVPNTFARNDYAFTTIDNTVSFDALANDGSGVYIQTSTDPSNGTVSQSGGVFTYTPDAGFSGSDQFTYEVCVIGQSTCETATAYLVVNNYVPSAPDFTLSTAKNTPLIINYTVPIGDWEFVTINEESDLGGTVEYFDGAYSGTIHGQQVDGFNLLVYTPPANEVEVTDYFEVEYCTSNGDCEIVKLNIDLYEIPASAGTDTLCVTECVWPGDVNNDGAVDILDVLPVGYCAGVVGIERENASLEWYAQYSEDWNESPGSASFDEKHVDTDGDGIITGQDTSAVNAFYGKYHNITPAPVAYLENIPLYFVPLTPNPGPGDLVEIEIVLGTPTVAAYDMYGLSFSVGYNADIVEEGTMNVQFYNENWMEYNSPMISMVKDMYSDSKVDIAYTRTSEVATSGYGVIGKLEFIVIDDLDFRLEEYIDFNLVHLIEPMVMNSAGQYVQTHGEDFTMKIGYTPDNRKGADLLVAYPNPVADLLKIHLNGKDEIEQIRVFTLTGELMYDSGRVATNHIEIDVSQYHDGMYIINALTSREMISKKVNVIKLD